MVVDLLRDITVKIYTNLLHLYGYRENRTLYKPTIRNNTTINIRFKGRSTVTGLFIRAGDYEELKSKNFWRVVHLLQLQKFSESHDLNIARIFNGASFTSLSETKL